MCACVRACVRACVCVCVTGERTEQCTSNRPMPFLKRDTEIFSCSYQQWCACFRRALPICLFHLILLLLLLLRLWQHTFPGEVVPDVTPTSRRRHAGHHAVPFCMWIKLVTETLLERHDSTISCRCELFRKNLGHNYLTIIKQSQVFDYNNKTVRSVCMTIIIQVFDYNKAVTSVWL